MYRMVITVWRLIKFLDPGIFSRIKYDSRNSSAPRTKSERLTCNVQQKSNFVPNFNQSVHGNNSVDVLQIN